jgi:hypothetical protein
MPRASVAPQRPVLMAQMDWDLVPSPGRLEPEHRASIALQRAQLDWELPPLPVRQHSGLQA